MNLPLTVVLPVYNRPDVSVKFVESFKKQINTFRLILVDDSLDSSIAEKIFSIHEDTVALFGSGMLWWGGSLQAAYDFINKNRIGGYVLLSNDDSPYCKNGVTYAMSLLEELPENTAILARAMDAGGNIVDRGVRVTLPILKFTSVDDDSEIEFASTRGLLLRESTFLSSNGFCPQRIPHYLSDYEFTRRLILRGIQIITDDAFVVFPNFELTGTHNIRSKNFKDDLKQVFSNRYSKNPIHLSWFVFKVFNFYWWPLLFVKIWLSTFFKFVLRRFQC